MKPVLLLIAFITCMVSTPVLAQADTAKAGIEGAKGISGRDEAFFIEEAVGGQINLAMHVDNFAL